jgi:molecular chaperone Hsp33
VHDLLLRGIVRDRGLRVILVQATELARLGRMLHGLAPTSAAVFAEALAAGLVLGALQKEDTRVNLHLKVDGPLAGLLVDADAQGNVRGWIRQPQVNFPGDPAVGRRASLGGGGTLSVLRDLGGGQFYRGSVDVGEGTLTEHLRHFFAESEQVETALEVAVLPAGKEPLGAVVAVLVQRLPDGDPAALGEVRARLASGALEAALQEGLPPAAAAAAVAGPGLEVLEEREVAYRCACSRERALNAVSALGNDGLASVLAQAPGERKVEMDCEFCKQVFVFDEPELRELARRLASGAGRGPGGSGADGGGTARA